MYMPKLIIGKEYIETINYEKVKVVAIKVTKKYGPLRPVRVRYQDGRYGQYATQDIITIKQAENDCGKRH